MASVWKTCIASLAVCYLWRATSTTEEVHDATEYDVYTTVDDGIAGRSSSRFLAHKDDDDAVEKMTAHDLHSEDHGSEDDDVLKPHSQDGDSKLGHGFWIINVFALLRPGSHGTEAFFVQQPTHFMPTTRMHLSEVERLQRNDFWVSAFVWLYCTTNVLGTAILQIGPWYKERVEASSNQYDPLPSTRALSIFLRCREDETQGNQPHIETYVSRAGSMRVFVFLLFGCYYIVIVGTVCWLAVTEHMSLHFGMAYEGWFFLLLCWCIWQLLQAVFVACQGKRYGNWRFVVAFLTSTAPFISDPFDSIKDAQFAAYCVIAQNKIVQGLGKVSLAWLLTFHLFFMRPVMWWNPAAWFDLHVKPADNDQVLHFAGAYGAVLYGSPVRGGKDEAGQASSSSPDIGDAGCFQRIKGLFTLQRMMPLLVVLYKQTTWTKLYFTMAEDFVQSCLAVAYLCLEGGNLVVIVANLGIPAAKVAFNLIAHRPLKSVVLNWLTEEMGHALTDDNVTKYEALFETLEEDVVDHKCRREMCMRRLAEGHTRGESQQALFAHFASNLDFWKEVKDKIEKGSFDEAATGSVKEYRHRELLITMAAEKLDVERFQALFPLLDNEETERERRDSACLEKYAICVQWLADELINEELQLEIMDAFADHLDAWKELTAKIREKNVNQQIVGKVVKRLFTKLENAMESKTFEAFQVFFELLGACEAEIEQRASVCKQRASICLQWVADGRFLQPFLPSLLDVFSHELEFWSEVRNKARKDEFTVDGLGAIIGYLLGEFNKHAHDDNLAQFETTGEYEALVSLVIKVHIKSVMTDPKLKARTSMRRLRSAICEDNAEDNAEDSAGETRDAISKLRARTLDFAATVLKDSSKMQSKVVAEMSSRDVKGDIVGHMQSQFDISLLNDDIDNFQIFYNMLENVKTFPPGRSSIWFNRLRSNEIGDRVKQQLYQEKLPQILEDSMVATRVLFSIERETVWCLQKNDWVGHPEKIMTIAAALAENTSLEVLKIRESLVTDDGTKAIAWALTKNKTMQTLELQSDIVTDDGAKALAESLELNDTLHNLALTSSQVTDESAKAFASALGTNTSLQQLILSASQVTDNGAEAMAAALGTNKTLETLVLEGSSVSAAGVVAIESAFGWKHEQSTSSAATAVAVVSAAAAEVTHSLAAISAAATTHVHHIANQLAGDSSGIDCSRVGLLVFRRPKVGEVQDLASAKPRSSRRSARNSKVNFGDLHKLNTQLSIIPPAESA